jgi:hypothetical protein
MSVRDLVEVSFREGQRGHLYDDQTNPTLLLLRTT